MQRKLLYVSKIREIITIFEEKILQPNRETVFILTPQEIPARILHCSLYAQGAHIGTVVIEITIRADDWIRLDILVAEVRHGGQTFGDEGLSGQKVVILVREVNAFE